ncbi:uncharacterized protein BX664DRAFT_329056 [Halteromyces radiatus]|uniref:uncharacterized protein n=1 Tax=Halteromyces radiatus TaxID=101107 RepID=UPI0022203549|nr:uncharacterized protein BX664DRAFT_329056 [Halteromyces radiatus]KAI8093156.1 hypothetical protein BX664DRAFT_329056 [Halteromyces radiatus]
MIMVLVLFVLMLMMVMTFLTNVCTQIRYSVIIAMHLMFTSQMIVLSMPFGSGWIICSIS